MKPKPLLPWVRILPEVGQSVREHAAAVDQARERARLFRAKARREYAALLREADVSAGHLEVRIAELWKPEEIAAAKRGNLWLNGKEYPTT